MNGKGSKRRRSSKPNLYQEGWERIWGDKALAGSLLAIIELWLVATGKTIKPKRGQMIRPCIKIRRD